MYLDKSALLAEDLPVEDLEVPELGTVRVRSLSRGEVLEVGKLTGPEMEMAAVARGLVEPKLTEEEVAQLYQSKRSTVIQAIVDKIVEISGIGGDSAKAAYKSSGS